MSEQETSLHTAVVRKWLQRTLRLMLSTSLPRNMSRIMLFASLNLPSLSNCSPANTNEGCTQHRLSQHTSCYCVSATKAKQDLHINTVRTLFPACTETAALPNDRMLLYFSTPTSTWGSPTY